MSQENQTGFFRRYFIACFQPENISCFWKKRRKSCGLFSFTAGFPSCGGYADPVWRVDGQRGRIPQSVLNRLPAFTLQDGTFESESPVSLEISGVLRVELNAEVEKYTEEDFNEEYQEEILVSRTNLLIRAGGQASELPLSAWEIFI